jgi:LysR family transcriptional regulator, regulator of the ytmI operon
MLAPRRASVITKCRDLCFSYGEAVDLRQLATFRAIVDAGNFARAAERLGIGASTVTLHVKQLEGDLGGPMFVRRGRQLDLTELGDSLRRHADAIARHLDALGEEAAELSEATRGTVRIGGIEPVAHLDLAPLLARLARGRPGVRVRLDVGGTALLSASVSEGRVAFAVCSAPPTELELLFEPLFREPVGLLLHENHALARRDRAVAAAELATHPVVVSEPGCAYRAQVVDTFRAAGLDLDVRAEIAGAPAVAAVVRAGLGVALVPLASHTPPPPGMTSRPLAGLDVGLDVGIVRPRAGEPYSALTAQVLATIRESAPRWRSAPRAVVRVGRGPSVQPSRSEP